MIPWCASTQPYQEPSAVHGEPSWEAATGEVLDDPGSFKTDEASKLLVLEHIQQPKPYPDLAYMAGEELITHLGLDYYERWISTRPGGFMAYVVAEPCIKCKYTDCVEVCPVDCFYEGPNFLVIHPDECIDCGACEPACPTKAIFPEESLPAKWSEYVQLNVDKCKSWPNITEKKDPLPDADQWKDVEDKRRMLEG